MREKMAEKIVDLVDQKLPPKEHLRPGQCVWNAVSISTRPDSPNCRLVPVILTLVDSSDVEQLARGIPMNEIAQQSIARICWCGAGTLPSQSSEKSGKPNKKDPCPMWEPFKTSAHA